MKNSTLSFTLNTIFLLTSIYKNLRLLPRNHEEIVSVTLKKFLKLVFIQKLKRRVTWNIVNFKSVLNPVGPIYENLADS